VAFRIIILAIAAAVILPAQPDKCAIRGEVVDTVHAMIPKPLIRVIAIEPMSVIYRGNADEGTFCIKDLAPGTYTVKAWANGFRGNSVRDVVVRSGETTEVGPIQLEVGSCDARGVNCDYFYTPETVPSKPEPVVEVVRADLQLPKECGADLARGKVICPPSKAPAKDIDVVFLEEHGALLLRPTNGARIQPSCKGAYRDQALRVEGFGMGDDLCIKTRKGYASHLFFGGDDVEPTTTQLTLWIVTKK
jgi:hypothetical protein